MELAPFIARPSEGYLAVRAQLPNLPQVFVFDTAFHQTMPPKAFMYGLPYNYYTDYNFRRYGAHGTSHRYVTARAGEVLGFDPKDVRIDYVPYRKLVQVSLLLIMANALIPLWDLPHWKE